MLKLEIAGKTITYKIAPEIPLKAAEALQETQERRLKLETEVELLRSQERQLRTFLGIRKGMPTGTIQTDGGH